MVLLPSLMVLFLRPQCCLDRVRLLRQYLLSEDDMHGRAKAHGMFARVFDAVVLLFIWASNNDQSVLVS